MQECYSKINQTDSISEKRQKDATSFGCTVYNVPRSDSRMEEKIVLYTTKE